MQLAIQLRLGMQALAEATQGRNAQQLLQRCATVHSYPVWLSQVLVALAWGCNGAQQARSARAACPDGGSSRQKLL